MVAKRKMFPRVSNVLPGDIFQENSRLVVPVYGAF